jgi:hypothetical protein
LNSVFIIRPTWLVIDPHPAPVNKTGENPVNLKLEMPIKEEIVV